MDQHVVSETTAIADIAAPSSTPPTAGPLRVRARAYVIGSAFIVASQFWLIECELVRWSLFTNIVPYCNALCLFAALLGVCGLYNGLRKPAVPILTRGELLAVFAMTCIGSALASAQMGQILVASLPFMSHYANPGNHYDRDIFPFLNKSVLVTDPTAVKNFYYGNSSIYLPQNFRPWLFPILFWTTFIIVLMWTMLCITSILRKRWSEAERLTYPVTFLPVEMTAGRPFWTNRMFWTGFGFAALVTAYNGIAYLYPTLPMLPIKRHSYDAFMQTPPWSDIGGVQTSFYPFAIGLAFLMPKDISFSLWFFFIAYKVEMFLNSYLGYIGVGTLGSGFDNSPPYEHGQAFGAYMSVCFMALWTARGYLREVWQTAFPRGGPKPLDDSVEPMRYRTAILGLAAGTVILGGYIYYLGMPVMVFLAFIVIFYAFCVVIARMRAEVGFPVHDMSNTGPMNLMTAAFGAKTLGARTMGVFGLTFWFNRTYFANPTPHMIESMRMADFGRSQQKDVVRTLMIATVVGAVTLFWSYLHIAYTLGVATARMLAGKIWAYEFPNDGFQTIQQWLGAPNVVNVAALKAVVFGFGFATLLGYLRQQFPWFPLHPIGYAVADCWGMAQIWLPIFIGWLIKMLITRYGGLRAYRRAVPMFLGLILGEMLVGGFWTLYGIFMGIRAYDFWP